MRRGRWTLNCSSWRGRARYGTKTLLLLLHLPKLACSVIESPRTPRCWFTVQSLKRARSVPVQCCFLFYFLCERRPWLRYKGPICKAPTWWFLAVRHIYVRLLAFPHNNYPPITYYWTDLLILNHSYLVDSNYAETKALQLLKSWHFCISNFRTCWFPKRIWGPRLGNLSNNRWSGGIRSVLRHVKSMYVRRLHCGNSN